MDLKFPVTIVVNETLRVRGWVEHYIPLGTRAAAWLHVTGQSKREVRSRVVSFFLSFN